MTAPSVRASALPISTVLHVPTTRPLSHALSNDVPCYTECMRLIWSWPSFDFGQDRMSVPTEWLALGRAWLPKATHNAKQVVSMKLDLALRSWCEEEVCRREASRTEAR